MSNFSMEQLHEVYELYLPIFTEIAQYANENNVHLELDISKNGDIEFMSREYFSEENKDFVRSHSIQQGKGYVTDSSRKVTLREKN